MSSTDKDEEIRRYLEGELSPEELKRFEQELAKDTDLANEVNDYENLVTGLEAAGMEHFKDEVRGWETEIRETLLPEKEMGIDKKKTPFKRYISIAASVGLLLAAGIFFYLIKPPAPESLYAEYYSPYPDMLTDRGDSTGNEPGRELLWAGIEAYNYENFELAVEKLQAYLEAEPGQVGVALYLAISQMELNKFEAATENFQKARQDPAFRQQAQWYEALLYLKEGDAARSQSILETIAGNPNHYRREQASRLMNSLGEKLSP